MQNDPIPSGGVDSEQLIGSRYRLRQPLGKGSFGQVFLAEDIKFKPPRIVALKLLHSQFLGDAQARDDISREASILARFNHPNILRVIDFDVSEKMAYIVTDVAQGGSLAAKLRPAPGQHPYRMPLEEAALYLDQICAALDEAHSMGLIHRDIKPLNILLDKSGRPLLADFGLSAALASSSSSILVDTNPSGTPLYMSPEQWSGQAGKASDIYSIGVLAFQMVTGQPPYLGNQAALAWQHMNAPVPSLSDRAPGLKYPPELDRVIATAMAKNPHERPRPASEFARLFRTAISGAASIPTDAETLNYGSPPTFIPPQVGPQTTPAPVPLNPNQVNTPVYAANNSSFSPPLTEAGLTPGQQSFPPPQPLPEIPVRKSSRLPILIIGGLAALLIFGALLFFLVMPGTKTQQQAVIPAATQNPAKTSGSSPSILVTTQVSSKPGQSGALISGGQTTSATGSGSKTQSNSTSPIPAGQGLARVQVVETEGKPVADGDIRLNIFKAGERENVFATANFSSKADIPLPPGTYEIVAKYVNGIEEDGQQFQIVEGQTASQVINLHVGHALVQVMEATGKTARDGDLRLSVFKAGDHDTEITTANYTTKANIVLKPGSYEIVAKYANGIEVATPSFEIKEGQSATQLINLHVGQAQVQIIEAEGKSAVDSDIRLSVYKPGDHDTEITNANYSSKSTLTLKPGMYELVVKYASGIEVVGPPLEIKEGQSVSQTLNLHVGKVQVQVVEAEGKGAVDSDVRLSVYIPGDLNTEITTANYSSKAIIVLKPGKYQLVARYTNGLEVEVPAFEVKEGQTAVQPVNLHVGRAKVTVVLSNGKPANDSDVRLNVYKQGDRDTVLTTANYSNKADIALKPGTYEIGVKYGNANEVIGPPLEVKEGQAAAQTLKV